MLLLNLTLFELSASAEEEKENADSAAINATDVDFEKFIILIPARVKKGIFYLREYVDLLPKHTAVTV